MTKIYRANTDFLILDEFCAGEAFDAEALMGLRFEAPAPGAHDQDGTPATLRYVGITRPPLGEDGKPDDRLPSLQVRVFTGELNPCDIKIVRDGDTSANAHGFHAPASHTIRAAVAN